nr:MAG TPA: hypothetical protein [Caudoviricetes sp.]
MRLPMTESKNLPLFCPLQQIKTLPTTLER